MHSFLSAAAEALSRPPTFNEALSGVFGSVSLTAWICLLLPQLFENYKAKDASGLSMAFLFVWLMGDVSNLSGALFSDLAPTAVALASYFCMADLVLISQCTYYNTRKARRAAAEAAAEHDNLDRPSVAEVSDHRSHRHDVEDHPAEDEPLLSRQRSAVRRTSSSGVNRPATLPGSHVRTHHAPRRTESSLDPLTRIVTGEMDEPPDSNPWLHNTLSVLAVYCVGILGWFIGYRMGVWDVPTGGTDDGLDGGTESQSTMTVGMMLGYFSAVCYLCARIPQIIKNYREKSCEGLALLFFLLSLTGNSTYGASLFAYSQKREDLIKALPWLLGSLGTMVEDCIIFVQFRIYAKPKQVK